MKIAFNNPEYLFLLILIPLLIIIHVLTMKANRRRAVKFANFEAIQRVTGVSILSKNLVSLILTILVVSLIIFTISGLEIHTTKTASQFSFIIVIDASQSMTTQDISPNRLEAAKKTAKDFIDFLPDFTRVGVVSFSGVAYIERDLTTDKFSAKSSIDTVNIKSVSGSNILEAVRTSANMLKEEEAKAAILLSDGQINVEGMQDVIDYANDNNVVVHTFGIGTLEGGRNDLFISKLDEDALKGLARNTEGNYYRIWSEQDFSNAFADVLKETKKQVTINASKYLMFAAVVLFILNWFLSVTRYKVLP